MKGSTAETARIVIANESVYPLKAPSPSRALTPARAVVVLYAVVMENRVGLYR